MLCVTGGAFGNRWVSMAQAFGATSLRSSASGASAPIRAHRRRDGRRDAEAGRRRALGDSTATVTRIETIASSRAVASACSRSTPSRASARCRSRPTPGASISSCRARRRACRRRPALRSRALSPAAWERSRETRTPRFYFDWKRTLDAQNGGGSPFTPATATVNALDVALDLVLAEGLEAIWERTRAMAGRFRARVLASGLGLYSPDDESCSLVTAVAVPEGPDANVLRRAVLDAGFIIEGGRGQTAGKVLRFGHLGATTRTGSTPAWTRCWRRCRNEQAALRRRRADRRLGTGTAARGLRGRRVRARR